MEDPEKLKKYMSPMADVMKKLQADGYKENFTIKEKKLHASSGQSFEARDVKIKNFYRFEGESDPADSSILYALETHNGVRGLLSDAFGPYADSEVTEFLNELEPVEKKEHLKKSEKEAQKKKEEEKGIIKEPEKVF